MKRVLVTLLVALIPFTAHCASEGKKRERANVPIELKANELYSDSNNRTATFVGKVVAKQGDMTIYSDKLVIHYAESREVDKVEATGNVNIIQGNNRGQAAHAVYNNRGGIITLDGNPKIFQGNNTVSGKVITYFVDEQRSIVVGGPTSSERVHVLIQPEEKKDGGAKR